MADKIGALLFSQMLQSGADRLNSNRTIVNDLNVFPIPDGDTGDNMYMTISSGCTAIKEKGFDSLDDIAKESAKGMLLGARGNSGVILSRIFSGLAKGLEGKYEADAKTISQAMICGVKEAYNAVSHPVDGTILSVFKDAVNYANGKIDDNTTLDIYFNDFLNELHLSLERTPDLLYVLKEAGVVDSGGAGFVYIIEGMKDALDGNFTLSSNDEHHITQKSIDLSKFNEDSELIYGYCTEFLLQLLNSKTDISSFNVKEAEKYLDLHGDSVVCFLEGSVLKIHVHTKKPGDILNHFQQYGEFLTLKIENMTLQHNETTIRNNYPSVSKKSKRKKYGIISVASGPGIINTFKELGCDKVIEGGQSMNPSTEEFLHAFDDINADTIFVFPNNSNIILTANQAADIYKGEVKKNIEIIKTKSIGEGYCAISMLDTELETDEIIKEAEENIKNVITAEITSATRDAVKDGIEIFKDYYLSICNNKVLLCRENKADTVISTCLGLEAGDFDIILLIQGSSSSDDESKALKKELEKSFPLTEVIIIKGDQPVYDYILIFE